jgi:hypothetical protein
MTEIAPDKGNTIRITFRLAGGMIE